MTVSLEEMLAEESEESRARIRLLAEEMRVELNLRVSKKLKIGQEGVSRIEKRTDLYLSTLRSYVEGVGGKLSLIVEFPDRAPVILTGLGENADYDEAPKSPKKKARATAKSKPKSRRAA